MDDIVRNEAAALSAAPAPAPRPPLPVVTLLLCGVSCLLFLGIAAQGGEPSWVSLAGWGYLPSNRIWEGAYWGLVSSAFVHLAPWHLAFNVYWLWVLGAAVERVLGPLRYLGLVVAAAVVSSSVQLGVSGGTGHGASGVVYALFGLMWASRRTVPAFAHVLGEKTAPLFWTWLVGCIVATAVGIAEIGNGAHVGGLAFGVLVAHGWLVKTTQRRLARMGTGLLAGVSLVPLFWSPWSSTWVGYRAYKAHVEGDYDTAIASYRRSIALGGHRLWALENLASAYHAKGAETDYAAALAEIRALDSSAAARIKAEIEQPGGSKP